MSRAYDNLPRQGVHLDEPVEEEPTTNVRAQEPAHPPDRTKATASIHVLSVDQSANRYRLTRIPKGSEERISDGFQTLDVVPEGGDLSRLYDGLPDGYSYAVFENTRTGDVYSTSDRRLEGDWTGDAKFDQVTIFRDEGDAAAYAEEIRESASTD